MIEVIVAYDMNETRERLNCVALLSIERKNYLAAEASRAHFERRLGDGE
jgi:hypothetical protein